MLAVGNLPRYMCQKLSNRACSDKVIAKIKWCSFLTHMVEYGWTDIRSGYLVPAGFPLSVEMPVAPNIANLLSNLMLLVAEG